MLIILTTPRTGSTLLQHSLAHHPEAKSGDEWLNPNLYDLSPEAHDLKVRGEQPNLIKIMYHDRKHPEFRELLEGATLIHLYRLDLVAQLDSWKRACETGIWSQEQIDTDPVRFKAPFPTDARQHIVESFTYYNQFKPMLLSYESMVLDWKGTIKTILKAARWKPMSLPMATKRIALT